MHLCPNCIIQILSCMSVFSFIGAYMKAKTGSLARIPGTSKETLKDVYRDVHLQVLSWSLQT